MATKYARAGGGNWSADATWSLSSGGGADTVAPTAADDVRLDAASGNVTIDSGGTRVARSVDCTGYTGTLTHAAATNWSIGDATAGTGNVALKLVAGMTYTLGNGQNSNLNFISTSTTQQTIDFGGKTTAQTTYNGVGGSWLLSSSHVTGTTASCILTNGTLNTNGQACTWGTFSSVNTNTRTLTLGSSIITCQFSSTGNVWDTGAGSNLTVNAETSHIILRCSATAPTFSGGGKTYYDVSATQSSGGFNISGSNTFHDLTQDNTVLGSGNRTLNPSAGTTQTINGTLTYKAFNATTSRGLFRSGTTGTTITIALGSTGTAALTDVDIQDVTITGTNTPVVAAAGRLGDGGGNSGITFDAPVTYYWNTGAVGGSMTTASNYSLSSGGSASTVVPLPHDVLIFDANSITAAGASILNDMFRLPTLDFTNVLNNPIYNPRNPSGATNAIYGSLIIKAGMTVSAAGAAGGTIPHDMRGRGAHTLDIGNVDMLTTFSLSLTSPGGSYTLQSDLTLAAARTLTHAIGGFDANGYDVTTGLFNSNNANLRSIEMGSGTWTITATSGTIWNMSTVTNLTFDAGTSVVDFSAGGAGTRTYALGSGISYYDVKVSSGSDIFASSGLGMRSHDLDFTGFSGTWTADGSTITGDLTLGDSMTITQSNTFNVTGDISRAGTTNIITWQSSVAGTRRTLNKTTGLVSLDYMSIKDSGATGGAYFSAGSNSTSVSNNTGWVFGNADFPATQSDTMTLSDSAYRVVQKLLQDTINMNDGISGKTHSRTQADTITLSDVIVRSKYDNKYFTLQSDESAVILENIVLGGS